MSPREYNVESRARRMLSVATPVVVRFLPPTRVRVFPSVMLWLEPPSPAAAKEVNPPPPPSVPQIIAPDESVSSESQDGRLVRSALAKMPPVKVVVPVLVNELRPENEFVALRCAKVEVDTHPGTPPVVTAKIVPRVPAERRLQVSEAEP